MDELELKLKSKIMCHLFFLVFVVIWTFVILSIVLGLLLRQPFSDILFCTVAVSVFSYVVDCFGAMSLFFVVPRALFVFPAIFLSRKFSGLLPVEFCLNYDTFLTKRAIKYQQKVKEMETFEREVRREVREDIERAKEARLFEAPGGWEGKLVVETTTEVLGSPWITHEAVLEIDAEGNVLSGIKIIGFVTPRGELYENLGRGIKASGGKPLFGDKPLGYIAGGTWFSPKHEKIGKWWKR